MNIFADFTQRILSIVESLGLQTKDGGTPDLSRIAVEPPRDASHGDLACNVAMVLARQVGRNPRELAQAIADAAILYNERNVRVFTVGYSGIPSIAALDDIAAAGGTTEAYEADDGDQLALVLGEIIGTVLPCSFELGGAPSDPSSIYVYANGTELTSGWTYDPINNEVTLSPPTCETLRQAGVVDLDIVFGCNVIPQ